MRVLLVIPAYNEEKSLGKLLSTLDEKFPLYDYVIINDCSKDNTKKIAEQHTERIIDLPINLGLSGAIKAGMLYAYQKNYDVCVQIDGDGQHLPEYIEPLIRELENGYDIVIGSRFLDGKKEYQQTLFRKIGASWLQFIAKLQSGLVLTDPTSGMRAYNKKVYEQIIMDMNAKPEPDTIVMFARNGYKVKEVPVVMQERFAGKSHLGGIFSSMRYMIHTTIAILLNPRRKIGK
ncbi:glycosyltransferase family 2 protein [Culicoidibacter larvae]|uniref:Glycosyltransferase family 2 protein n=1 Tax=Culicoidibacter larvae TaxID=2579976 RepID=A0A5R8Q6R9_9FIRM|nr:glycosyltransferase family 2 protein [Culicoidibacter larvae]TLG71112.1 glycosyltransferase family 2 protein [Culicoidibacter larvae]